MQRKWLIELRGNLTHQQMADKTGISRPFYSQLESGIRTPSVPVAKKISRNLDIDWVIFFDPKCFDKHQMNATGTDGN